MKRFLISIVMALALASTASAQDQPNISTDSPVGPRDVIDVKVFQDSSLNSHAQIGDDGRINLPLIGKIEVSGLTPSQIELKIKTLLEARFLAKADVAVQVAEYGNKPISVIGAVTRPGRIGVTGNITLIQAITQAGGLASGYGKTLYVLRTGQNGLTEQISVDIEDLMVNGNPDLNLPLAANDVVNVPMDTPVTIYVMGEVMHPGTVQFRRSQTPTLLQALAGAGGPTDRASRTVKVKRVIRGKETTLTVNYRQIIDGRIDDMQLQDSDRIYVYESFF